MAEIKDLDKTLIINQAGEVLSSAPDDAAPKRIAHYDIRREIGRGTRSVVYEAQDTQTGQEVALKMLTLPPSASAEEAGGLIADFEREAHIAARLSHPNIVRTCEVSPLLNRHFIVMEHLQGQTLRDRISGGKLTPEEAFSILTQIALALDAVHKAGIVHRDVKPANIMLLSNGAVKLLDFGNARVSAEPIVMTGGVVVGSPSYMAPEQINGETGTAGTDVWALGALSCEMLAGKLPFTGLTVGGVMFQIMHLPPAPMPDLQPAVQMVLLRALARRPSQRYAAASAFVQALKSAHLGQAPAPAEHKPAEFVPLSVPRPLLLPKWLPRAVLVSLFLLGFCGAVLVRLQAARHQQKETGSQASVSSPILRVSPASLAPVPSFVPTVPVPAKAQTAHQVHQTVLLSVARPKPYGKYPVMQVKQAAALPMQVHIVQTRTARTIALVPVPQRRLSVMIKSSFSVLSDIHKQIARQPIPAPPTVRHGALVQIVPQPVEIWTVSRRVPEQVASQPVPASKTDHSESVQSASPPVTADSRADRSFTLPDDEGGYDPEAAARQRKSAWSQNGSAPSH